MARGPALIASAFDARDTAGTGRSHALPDATVLSAPRRRATRSVRHRLAALATSDAPDLQTTSVAAPASGAILAGRRAGSSSPSSPRKTSSIASNLARREFLHGRPRRHVL